MKLHARWTGLPPRVGEFLVSPTKPRFAYCIRSVRCIDSCVRWDPAQKKELRRLALEVDRVPIAKLPTAARVHDWIWNKRGSKA